MQHCLEKNLTNGNTKRAVLQNSRSSTELHNSVALLKAMVIEKRKSVPVLIVKKTSFHLDILQPLELANNVQFDSGVPGGYYDGRLGQPDVDANLLRCLSRLPNLGLRLQSAAVSLAKFLDQVDSTNLGTLSSI